MTESTAARRQRHRRHARVPFDLQLAAARAGGPPLVAFVAAVAQHIGPAGVCFAATATLAALCGVSERQARRIQRAAVAAGLVVVESVPGEPNRIRLGVPGPDSGDRATPDTHDRPAPDTSVRPSEREGADTFGRRGGHSRHRPRTPMSAEQEKQQGRSNTPAPPSADGGLRDDARSRERDAPPIEAGSLDFLNARRRLLAEQRAELAKGRR